LVIVNNFIDKSPYKETISEIEKQLNYWRYMLY
jgi:hypothetical protein